MVGRKSVFLLKMLKIHLLMGLYGEEEGVFLLRQTGFFLPVILVCLKKA